jgi:hypothetical protein
MRDSDSPIEDYLDALHVALGTDRPREARHLLTEAEAHLRDAAEAAAAQGSSPFEAEQAAVRRFGDARVIARADARALRPRAAVAWECAMGAWLLGGLGAVAIGLSGVLAAAMRLLVGARFLADAAPGKSVDPSACGRWLALSPHATSCHAAAIADWANETVAYRIAFGLLGVAVLAAYALARRRLGRRARPPALLLDAVATTAFGLAGCGALLLAANALTAGAGHGVGQWLSAAIVALPAAAVAGRRLARDLEAGAPTSVAGP